MALTVLSEAIARGCGSSALCYAMHCVGTAVIAAKATKRHEDRYLVPIADGRHVTTLALSESGTGARFYLPQTTLTRAGDAFAVSDDARASHVMAPTTDVLRVWAARLLLGRLLL